MGTTQVHRNHRLRRTRIVGANGRLDPWAIKRAIGEGGRRPYRVAMWLAAVAGLVGLLIGELA